MSIHVAIIRRVRPGCEAEFQQGLREFIQRSFAHGGVYGATMLTPLPGSNSREFGILRTFADKEECEAFYASPLFKAWDERARTLTEGEPEHRQLHGLEAWFRTQQALPPRWKMAVATFLGVFPTVEFLKLAIGPVLGSLPSLVSSAVFNACTVVLLTWVVMPAITRILASWLESGSSGRGREPSQPN
jgi:hypothetical protein